MLFDQVRSCEMIAQAGIHFSYVEWKMHLAPFLGGQPLKETKKMFLRAVDEHIYESKIQ